MNTTNLRTRPRLLSATIVMLSLIAASPVSAFYDCEEGPSCSLPATPKELVGDGTTGEKGTNDKRYVKLWKGKSSKIDRIWEVVRGVECDWNDGWGYYEPSNLEWPLSRLMNGVQVIDMVTEYSIPFGLHRKLTLSSLPYGWRGNCASLPGHNSICCYLNEIGGVTCGGPACTGVGTQCVTDIGFNYQNGAWFQFTSDDTNYHWAAGCNRELNGEYKDIPFVDDKFYLHVGGAYGSSAVQRAGTIVHETFHPHLKHLDLCDFFGNNCEAEGYCAADQVSCDRVYGEANATTMEVNFWHDALIACATKPAPGTPAGRVMKTAITGDTCNWIPLFSEDERREVLFRSIFYMSGRFADDAYSGWKSKLLKQVVDRQKAEKWPCVHLDPSKWEFDPDVCNQAACNEIVNPDNAAINATNISLTNAYNATLETAPPQEAMSQLKATLDSELRKCAAPDADAALAYCRSEQEDASQVADIDECGWLDSVQDGAASKLACVQEYCRTKFVEDSWSPGEDPYGCMDYLCGGDSCGNGAVQAECERLFFDVKGDPVGYVAQCSWDPCVKSFIECLASEGWIPGDGENGENPPYPAQCRTTLNECGLTAALKLAVFLNADVFVNPADPVELRGVNPLDFVDVNKRQNPGVMLREVAAHFRQAWANRHGEQAGPSVERRARHLLTSPEMLTALYNASPQDFVGVFGKDGLEEVVGSRITNVVGRELTEERLTPDGQNAKQELAGHLGAAASRLQVR